VVIFGDGTLKNYLSRLALNPGMTIPLISVSQIARITGMSHQCPVWAFFLSYENVLDLNSGNGCTTL
jgi:hypothetical protein